MQRPERKLTVMVSVDMADSQRHMNADENDTLRELARIRRDVAGPLLKLHRGVLFKEMGDGGLIEFVSVEDAVSWTLDFQEAMAKRNASAVEPIRFRAAVALADVVVEGEERYGAAIGFVVHLQEVAPPGGVALTHSVRWQLTKSLASRFTRTEMRRIKGHDDLFEVWIHGELPEDALTPTSPISTPAASARGVDASRPTLVVIPFSNLTGDASRNALIEGVVEELTHSLSRSTDFSVVSSEAASAALDSRFMAMEIGARYVLSGGVRVSGDRIRVGAQVMEAHTRAVLWSDRFEGDVRDAFALEDSVATSVAGALHTVVRAAEIARTQRKGVARLTPLDHIYRAMPRFWAHRRDENEIAIAELDAALALAPDHALALALQGWCLSQRVTYIWSHDVEGDKARAFACAAAAARLADDDALTLTAIGAIYSILDVDQTRALSYIDRALARDPHLSWAWLRAGYARAYNGDPREGLRCFERALALSPFDPIKFNIHAGLGVCHFLLGDYAQAKDCAARALDNKPGMVWANRLLATAAAHAGDMTVARRAVDRLLAENPDLTVNGVAAAIHNLAGRDLDRYLDGLRAAGLPDHPAATSNVVLFEPRARVGVKG